MRNLASLVISAVILTVSCAYNLSIPESIVNEFLKKEFPKKEKVLLSEITLKNPVLKLLGNNEGELILNVDVKPPIGGQIKAKVDAIGKFTFERENKTLYLVGLEPKSISVNGKEYRNSLLNKIVNALISGTLNKIPVYKLTGIKAKLIKGISIEKGKIAVKVGI